jgi:glycosyltransferase involved in cell wall biosynthesis
MRKLRIGQISPLNLPVPPKKYGGTERIIYWLCQELTKKGHKVFLFGTADSQVNCTLIPVVKKGLWEKRQGENSPYYAYEMALVGQKARELGLDILHDHLGPWSLTLYGQTETPVLHTLHIPFHNKSRIWAYQKLNANLISISNSQRKKAPRLNYLATIYNGIDVENFPFNPKPKDYFVWVGELSPRKGISQVLQIAKLAKIKLLIAGRIPPPEQKNDHLFFKKHIERKLNKGNIFYMGELSGERLKKVYKNAVAFLYPLQWEEPFGLTMVESMACGTPVIAFKRGSVPEVIKDKKVGFVVKPFLPDKKQNFLGFLEAIRNIGKISRKECRSWAEQNFSTKRMADDYEKVYYQILNAKIKR